ncbi:MAG: hypothetical protein IT247_01050 [Bacteroidia bacterium]|nr:hypothetical protein [Bacteroidia bacterium]
MSLNSQTFKYEVAFSFLHQDEGLAFGIKELIQDRFATFLYAEHQKDLVGRDGEQKFSDVFQKEARIVVILYRSEWGETPWTRVEKEAIRSRGHNTGYDFTIFVKLDNQEVPGWLPKYRLYHDYERWGVKGLASIIESKIQEAGGENRIEGLEEKTARAERRVRLDKKRQQFLRRDNAVEEAEDEFESLVGYIKEREDLIKQFKTGNSEHSRRYYTIRCKKYELRFYWQRERSLDESILHIDLLKLHVAPGFGSRPFTPKEGEYKKIQSKSYDFDFNPATETIGWSERNGEKEVVLSSKLVDFWLMRFVDEVSNSG